MKVYIHYILPLPNREEWIVIDAANVHPPLICKPKRKRRRQTGKAKTNKAKVSCFRGDVCRDNCHQIGHNVRGCKAIINGVSLWQRRKRITREKEQVTQASTSISEAASCPTKKYQARIRT